eukprot:SAG11_NODE_10882_length_799_cov_1.327143_1_plen_165_part_00
MRVVGSDGKAGGVRVRCVDTARSVSSIGSSGTTVTTCGGSSGRPLAAMPRTLLHAALCALALSRRNVQVFAQEDVFHPGGNPSPVQHNDRLEVCNSGFMMHALASVEEFEKDPHPTDAVCPCGHNTTCLICDPRAMMCDLLHFHFVPFHPWLDLCMVPLRTVSS